MGTESNVDTSRTPINDPESTRIPPGSRAEFRFSPDKTGSDVVVRTVAASAHSGLTYEIVSGTGDDRQTEFESSSVPPTDVDDCCQTFFPPLVFDDQLSVVVRNVGTIGRSVTVQLIGWEVV